MSYFLGLGIFLVQGNWRRTLLTLVLVSYVVIWRSNRSRNPLSTRMTVEKNGPYSPNSHSAEGDAVPALWVAMMAIADVVRSKPRRDSIDNPRGEQKAFASGKAPNWPAVASAPRCLLPVASTAPSVDISNDKRARPALQLQGHAQRCMVATRQAMRLEACRAARSDLASGPPGVHCQPSCT